MTCSVTVKGNSAMVQWFFCLGKGDGTVRYLNCNFRSLNPILLHILLRGAARAHCWPNRAISRPGSTSIIRVSGPIANLRSDPAVLANTHIHRALYIQRRSSSMWEMARFLTDHFYFVMLFGTESYKRNPPRFMAESKVTILLGCAG